MSPRENNFSGYDKLAYDISKGTAETLYAVGAPVVYTAPAFCALDKAIGMYNLPGLEASCQAYRDVINDHAPKTPNPVTKKHIELYGSMLR